MTSRIACLLFLLFCNSAVAGIGEVVFVHGAVTLTRAAQTLVPNQGDSLEQGDEIRTGDNGRIEMRLSDGARIGLRPNSRFVFRSYRRPASPSSSKGVSQSRNANQQQKGGVNVMRLLKGGVRTMTGTIGSGQDDEYRLETNVATIGVRGTHYQAVMCEAGSCGDDIADGLHVSVSDGSVIVSNDLGSLILDEGDFGFVADSRSQPSRGSAGSSGAKGQNGGAKNEPATNTRTNFPTRQERSISFGVSANRAEDAPQAPFTSTVVNRSSQLQTQKDQALVRFQGPLSATDQTGSYRVGDAQVVERHFDPNTDMAWGRWSNGVANVDGEPLSLHTQSLHWINAPAGDARALPSTGVFSYQLSGSTAPTGMNDGGGVLESATLQADFSQQTVDASLNLRLDNRQWSAIGSAPLVVEQGAPVFAGTFDQVTVGTDAGSGEFAGFFTGTAQAGVAPEAAGLTYGLQGSGDTANEFVTGAAVFNQPTDVTDEMVMPVTESTVEPN